MTTLNIFTLLQETHPLLYIGLLLLCGYVGGEFAHLCRFPRVSGYLVTGILLGPSGIGLFHSNLVHQELNLITHIALGIIAFSIGGSLEIRKITSLGRQIAWITICQTLGAVLVTTTVLTLTLPFFCQTPDSNSLWHLFFPVALTLGAMSAATAPATILAVIHEYRARGPFTSTLLGVVALDDGLTIILYTVATTISGNLLHLEKLNWQNLLFSSAYPILVALVIGALLAAIIRWLIHLVPRSGAILGVMLGFIFLGSGLALTLEVSPLLVNMMMGFTVVNCVKHHYDFFYPDREPGRGHFQHVFYPGRGSPQYRSFTDGRWPGPDHHDKPLYRQAFRELVWSYAISVSFADQTLSRLGPFTQSRGHRGIDPGGQRITGGTSFFYHDLKRGLGIGINQ